MAYSLLVRRSLAIRRTLGLPRAAGYLRNRDVSLRDALSILIGPAAALRAPKD